MIETRDLTKMYGDLYALNRLTLKLERGDVYGFIGPNGSGKTTTMRILATLLNPSWGEATVCGYSIYNGAREIRRLMGFMPDFFGIYDDMKVIEYLEFFAAAYRIKGPGRRRKCEQVLDLVDLGYKRDALATSLSRGMTQRLGLARVLLHEPQVLLLDEPASGLDPRARIELRRLLRELRTMGKTILVSSHILPELSDICNKIGIIEKGVLLFDGDVDAAIRQVRQRTVMIVGVAGGLNQVAKGHLQGHPDIAHIELKPDGGLLVALHNGVSGGNFIAEILDKKGIPLTILREQDESSEQTRISVTFTNGINQIAKTHLKNHPDIGGVELKEDGTLQVTLNDGVQDGSFIADILYQNGFRLKLFKEEEIDLEDVFIRITKGLTN
jgi:ABC-2 type transport system ATP-binding protein